jgi:hypothetical protein
MNQSCRTNYFDTIFSIAFFKIIKNNKKSPQKTTLEREKKRKGVTGPKLLCKELAKCIERSTSFCHHQNLTKCSQNIQYNNG